MASKGVNIPINLDIDLSTIRKQGQEIGGILQRALNKNTRMQALDRLERQIGRSRDKIRNLQDDLQKAMTTEIPTKPFKALEEAAADVHKELDVIIKDFAKASGLSFEEAGKALRKSFDTGIFKAGMINFEDIEKLADLYGRLDSISKKQDELRAKGKVSFIDENAIKRLQQQLGVTKEQLQELIIRYRELAQNSGNSIQNSLQPIINFNNEISQTMGAFRQAFGPYVQVAQTAMQGLVKVTELEVKALAKVGEVAISAFKPLVSMAQLAGKAIGGIFSSIKKHNETTMKNLWRNILRYGIGVRSMYFLVRKIRNVIGEVIQELAKQIPEVNAQMSAFKTAVNGLKGALATAFQPILTAVLPALTALINAVSKAIAVVGKFIALLTGQNFVYAATATQVDYAASLDKTGKSAKKAKKELEGYLSPIDEINKYQSKRDDDDDSGSGGGGSEAPFTLKKVPIEDWIKDFWDRIKKSWETGDFYWLGKMLGDKLAKALASIPWDKIRANARKLGKSLATLLNGFMDGEFDGQKLSTLIGTTIAQAINTAFEFVYGFVKNFNWERLGEFITEAFHGLFDNLDWNLITSTIIEFGKGIGETLEKIFEDHELFAKAGDALARTINAIIYGTFALLNQLDGVEIGKSIASFINGAIDRLDLQAFVVTCNKLMNTILDALIYAVSNIKWDQLGTKLAEAFNKIDFKGIFSRYKTLANTIIDALLDMLESFLNDLSPDKITEIGESIADFINGLDFQPERLASVANRLLNALLDIILTTVQDINWDKIADDVATFLGEIDWVGILLKVVAIKSKIESSLFKIILEAIVSVIEKVKKQIFNFAINVMDGFIEGLSDGNPIKRILEIFRNILVAIKGFFGIHSPSTVFLEIGKNIVDGFINGVRAIIDKAKEIWEKVKAGAHLLWGSIKLAITDKAREIYTNVVDKFTEIKSKITETVENIKTKVTDTWESMKTTVIEIFEGMWDGIKTVINSILAGIESMVNGIIKGINFASESLNSMSFDPPEWIQSKFGIGSLQLHLPTLGEVSLPRLAQGAVIPPNKEFMAVLGDQKSGTNIETPLSTMVEAFNTALRQNGGGVKTINFLLPDRRTLAQYTIAGGRVIQTSTGKNPFELA